jgi:hypothetical protein
VYAGTERVQVTAKEWRNGASHERLQVITEVDRRGDRGAVPSEMPVILMEASVVFSARDALFGADSALQDQHGILRPNIRISIVSLPDIDQLLLSWNEDDPVYLGL